MARQLGVIAEKALLTPANVIRGLPVKTAATELAAKPSPLGKYGWRGMWPPEYSKPPNPRLMPWPYTFSAKMRTAPWQFTWEYAPIWRFVVYGNIVAFLFLFWLDKNVMQKANTKKVLTAMVTDDLNEQRRVLYQHTQKHHDHHYFKHKGCHDEHPLGHGVSDPHVF